MGKCLGINPGLCIKGFYNNAQAPQFPFGSTGIAVRAGKIDEKIQNSHSFYLHSLIPFRLRRKIFTLQLFELW